MSRLRLFFQNLLYLSHIFPLDPSELEEQPQHRCWWHPTGNGGMISVSVRNPEGNRLFLTFQRKIEALDVKDGKLAPSVWTGVKRRGGKRQTVLPLSTKRAEILHALLGKAIKDARKRQRRMQVLDFFFTYTAAISAVTTARHTK